MSTKCSILKIRAGESSTHNRMLQNNLRPDAHDDFTLRTIYDGQGVFDCGEIYQYVIIRKRKTKNLWE